MSSPLASLKKTPRAHLPLAGARNVPFRQAQYSESENDLLEEVTSTMAASRLKDHKKLAKHPSATSEEVPNDHQLMTLMSTRLANLEKRLQLQSQEVIEKDKKIRILEEKVKLLQKARDESSPSKVHELENKCLSLQKQVYEMEKFLEDYGMIWVGETNEDAEEEANDTLLSARSAASWEPLKSVPDSQTPVDINFDLLIKNIAELNIIAGEGIAQIKRSVGGAQFHLPDPVPLILYANGILLFSGPFRPYTDATTIQFVQDILDGYFPSELQSRYPDGTPLKVTDKRTVAFEDRRQAVFAGEGKRLASGTKASPRAANPTDKTTPPPRSKQALSTESVLPGPQLTVQQFLNTLPSAVMRNGSVIDIRNSVGEILKGPEGTKSTVTVVETTAVKDMQTRLQQPDALRDADPKRVTTLRIKAEDGNQTFVVKMHFTETIGKLREYLAKTGSVIPGKFDIVSTFPSRTYSDDKATLESCGLVPNAALHLRRRK